MAEGSCSFFASLRLGGQPSPPFRFFLLHNLLSFNRFRAIFSSCTKMIDSSIEESKLVFRSRRRSRQPIFPSLSVLIKNWAFDIGHWTFNIQVSLHALCSMRPASSGFSGISQVRKSTAQRWMYRYSRSCGTASKCTDLQTGTFFQLACFFHK